MRLLPARRWIDLPLRDKALVVISLPLVILLMSLVLIYITERQTAHAEEDVRRVLRVQAAASVRGYLLTQREDFLPSYLKVRPQIDAALQRLNRNVRDERVRRQLAAIEPLINSKIAGLEEMLGEHSNKHILDELREHIGTILTLEDTLLAERTAAAAETRQRLLLSTLLAAFCGLFGAIVAVLFLSKGIVARVQQVKGNAQRLALGQPLQPQPPEHDEIGQLGTRLVEAGLLLAERERALRDNEELIIDGVKDYGIFALDTEGFVTSWNAGAERIKGYTEQEIIGQCSTCRRNARSIPSMHCARRPAMVTTWKKPGAFARMAAASGPAW